MYLFALLKCHGCVRCCKYVFGTYNQHTCRMKKPLSRRAKVLATAAVISPSPAAIDNLSHTPRKFLNGKSTESSNINDNRHELRQDHVQVVERSNICTIPCPTTMDTLNGGRESKKHDFSPNSLDGGIIFFPKSNKYFILPDFKDNSQNDFVLNLRTLRKVTEESSQMINIPGSCKGEKAESNEQVTIVDAVSLDWHQQNFNLRLLPQYYMSLAKIRLTGLVVLTTIAGYGLASAPIEPLTFLCVILGTGFTSAAANAVNQFLEVPYDSQMNRTKNRVLVRGLLTPLHTVSFAACSALMGLSILYCGVNGVVTALGAVNLILYTSIYTPMKRCSTLNTWVGSVVGAIPPLMGWAACTGSLSADALLIGAVLYSWQFPHFNALSWNLRPDYSRAGYRMMSVINPKLCRRTALRHSIAILVLCTMSPLLNLTDWTFAVDSFPLNCYLIYRAWQFHQNADSQSSRKLFRLSLMHLPILMLLMFIGKKHMPKKKEEYDKKLSLLK